jgi:hypothetical protein
MEYKDLTSETVQIRCCVPTEEAAGNQMATTNERWVTRKKIQNTEIEGQMDNYLPTENFQIWDCKGNEPH